MLKKFGITTFIDYLKSSFYKDKDKFVDADFPWEECLVKMEGEYGDKETAQKVCAAIKNRSVAFAIENKLADTEENAIKLIHAEVSKPSIASYLAKKLFNATSNVPGKVCTIDITGQIGSYSDKTGKMVKGFDLLDAISAVQKCKDAETILVNINSPGGLVSAGFDIYDYLKSLKKKIVTRISGQCASIATVVALAGDDREIVKGSEYLIHNPWLQNISGDADKLAELAAATKNEEDKLIDFYHKHTDISKQGLDALMKQDAPMSIEKALELGFVTKIVEPTTTVPKAVKAFAIINPKTTTNKNNIMKKFTAMFTALCKELNIDIKNDNAPASITMKTSDGKDVSIADPDGDGVAQVGDLCTMDGKPCASMTMTMEDGSAIETDENGAIKTITPAQAIAPTITDDAQFVEEVKKALEGTGIEVVTGEKKAVKAENIIVALKTLVTAKKNADAKVISEAKKLIDFETKAIAQLTALKDQIKTNFVPAETVGSFRTKLDSKNAAEKGTLGVIEKFRNRHKKEEKK